MRKAINIDETHHTMLVEITKVDNRGTYVNTLNTLIEERYDEIKREPDVSFDRKRV